MTTPRRVFGVLAVVAASAAALAGCSSAAKPTAATSRQPAASSSAAPSTPPSTPPPATASASRARAVYPLTGLPVADAAHARRPALSVKIDNIDAARPQAGLERADLVTEVLVEGGLTRLMATYQSQDAPVIGPIRSARPVDADLLRELRGGYFAYSGADPREIAPVRAHSGALLMSWDADPRPFVTDPHRVRPHQVFSSTERLYSWGEARAPHMPAPPQLFRYGAAPAGGHPATTVTLPFSSFTHIVWRWNSASHRWLRTQNGTPDVLVDGRQIATTDVVVISAGVRGTGIRDDAGNEDPLDVVIGSGDAWLLRDGTMTRGRWVRPSYTTPMRLVGRDGRPLTLRPGQAWLEVLPTPYRPQVG